MNRNLYTSIARQLPPGLSDNAPVLVDTREHMIIGVNSFVTLFAASDLLPHIVHSRAGEIRNAAFREIYPFAYPEYYIG